MDSLSNSGYHVDLAIDGGDGLRRGRSNEYAVMTIDRMLPGLDGLFVFGGCANTESARIPSSRLSDPQCRPHYDGTFAAYDAKALNETSTSAAQFRLLRSAFDPNYDRMSQVSRVTPPIRHPLDHWCEWPTSRCDPGRRVSPNLPPVQSAKH